MTVLEESHVISVLKNLITLRIKREKEELGRKFNKDNIGVTAEKIINFIVKMNVKLA